jgi:hypothetical protein
MGSLAWAVAFSLGCAPLIFSMVKDAMMLFDRINRSNFRLLSGRP